MERMRATHGNFARLSQSRANDSKCGGERLMHEQCDAHLACAPPFRHTACNERLTFSPRTTAFTADCK
jgi:hypothetical protein